MRIPVKLALASALCPLALCVASAQQTAPKPAISEIAPQALPKTAPSKTAPSNATTQAPTTTHPRRPSRTLTADDGLAVISAALDPKVRRYAGNDCSHLVHAIYERAGFPYEYASSDDLYDGVDRFQRVIHPQPGDVVVWHGHAGIVVRPSRHVFFSFMSAGPGIDDYQSTYWTTRGEPRFYRYIKKTPCPGCTTVNTASRRTRPEE